ncbi:hypothetical protein Tco_1077834 [Tanacetum coccineum]
MAASTIPISAKENLRDPIDIRVDIIHPQPVTAVAFPATVVVRTQAKHGEAIRGILQHLQGVPIEEEMSTLRFRMGMVEAENASLRVGFSSGVIATGPRELQEALGVSHQSAQTSPIDTIAQKLENIKHEDVGGMIRKDILKEKLEIE